MGQNFVATCLVNTVEGVSVGEVNIAWHSSEGEVMNSSGRVIVGNVQAINASWFARTVTILQLEMADSGDYICRSSISGQYVYSEVTENMGTLEVGQGRLLFNIRIECS